MRRWGTVAILIFAPCLLALAAYDAVAVFLLRQGQYALVPVHDFARGLLQDLGLAVVYGLTITPRILPLVADRPSRPTYYALVMLGLGIAWYDVLCAFVTRMFAEPSDAVAALVVLFGIPILISPWYFRWLQLKAHGT
jgi:hypothetical protein